MDVSAARPSLAKQGSLSSPLLSFPRQLVSITHLFPFTNDVTNKHLPNSWRTQLRNLTLCNVVTEGASLAECDAVFSCLVPDVSNAYSDFTFRDPAAQNNLTAWPLQLKTLWSNHSRPSYKLQRTWCCYWATDWLKFFSSPKRLVSIQPPVQWIHWVPSSR